MDFEEWWKCQKFNAFQKKHEPARYTNLTIAKEAWQASRENQQGYQKHEFCEADACAFADIKDSCPLKPEDCKRTAKEFHDWLKDNRYKIVKLQ
jgi:hypothetical protein